MARKPCRTDSRSDAFGSIGSGAFSPSRDESLSDFLARHRAAPALDHLQRGIDLVGAVEQEIEAPDLLETADNESQRGRQIVRGLAGGDAAKVQPLRRGALRQGANGPRRGPARAQAHLHAADDVLDSRGRQQVLRHACLVSFAVKLRPTYCVVKATALPNP
jgi:hypothetical protein